MISPAPTPVSPPPSSLQKAPTAVVPSFPSIIICHQPVTHTRLVLVAYKCCAVLVHLCVPPKDKYTLGVVNEHTIYSLYTLSRPSRYAAPWSDIARRSSTVLFAIATSSMLPRHQTFGREMLSATPVGCLRRRSTKDALVPQNMLDLQVDVDLSHHTRILHRGMKLATWNRKR